MQTQSSLSYFRQRFSHSGHLYLFLFYDFNSNNLRISHLIRHKISCLVRRKIHANLLRFEIPEEFMRNFAFSAKILNQFVIGSINISLHLTTDLTTLQNKFDFKK
jgi:EAL domain-containing protein (putative c-di-GMP-specific phosphodiesterase class I)